MSYGSDIVKGHEHSPRGAGKIKLHKDFHARENSDSHVVIPEHCNRDWGLDRLFGSQDD